MERRPEYIALLREQRANGVALPLERAVARGKAQAHGARLRFDAEVAKEGREIWVVEFVVNDEAGVDGDGRALIIDLDGVAMSADARVFFIEHDVVTAVQRPRRAHARNSRTYDGDTHWRRSSLNRSEPSPGRVRSGDANAFG